MSYVDAYFDDPISPELLKEMMAKDNTQNIQSNIRFTMMIQEANIKAFMAIRSVEL